ncbi:hypothetical protein, partial [Streptomyces caniscabiei]|uniref:hypothetical protein n=1 Tax=Streptomyces caniscabiei TaxID=2746961 RepID=UPI003B97D2A5
MAFTTLGRRSAGSAPRSASQRFPLPARRTRLRAASGGRYTARSGGALAERLAVPATSLHALPDSVDAGSAR